MVYEAREQSMAWMETDYSKHAHFLSKTKWRLEHLGALGIMGEIAQGIHCLAKHHKEEGFSNLCQKHSNVFTTRIQTSIAVNAEQSASRVTS